MNPFGWQEQVESVEALAKRDNWSPWRLREHVMMIVKFVGKEWDEDLWRGANIGVTRIEHHLLIDLIHGNPTENGEYDAKRTYRLFANAARRFWPQSAFANLSASKGFNINPIYLSLKAEIDEKLGKDTVQNSVVPHVVSRLRKTVRFPLGWNEDRRRRAIMAIMAHRSGLLFCDRMIRNPHAYPWTRLETRLLEQSNYRYQVYMEKAAKFNRDAPVPVIVYRSLNKHKFKAMR